MKKFFICNNTYGAAITNEDMSKMLYIPFALTKRDVESMAEDMRTRYPNDIGKMELFGVVRSFTDDASVIRNFINSERGNESPLFVIVSTRDEEFSSSDWAALIKDMDISPTVVHVGFDSREADNYLMINEYGGRYLEVLFAVGELLGGNNHA